MILMLSLVFLSRLWTGGVHPVVVDSVGLTVATRRSALGSVYFTLADICIVFFRLAILVDIKCYRSIANTGFQKWWRESLEHIGELCG